MVGRGRGFESPHLHESCVTTCEGTQSSTGERVHLSRRYLWRRSIAGQRWSAVWLSQPSFSLREFSWLFFYLTSNRFRREPIVPTARAFLSRSLIIGSGSGSRSPC